MSSFQRVVRDGVFDSLVTDQLTANSVVVRKVLTTPTLNADEINIPSTPLFIPDDNQVLGPGTGASFVFSRISNIVVAQLTFDPAGTVVNSGSMQFTIPAPYSPDSVDIYTTEPAGMCINSVQSWGFAAFGTGVIQISPEMGMAFTAGDVIQVFGKTFVYTV